MKRIPRWLLSIDIDLQRSGAYLPNKFTVRQLAAICKWHKWYNKEERNRSMRCVKQWLQRNMTPVGKAEPYGSELPANLYSGDELFKMVDAYLEYRGLKNQNLTKKTKS